MKAKTLDTLPSTLNTLMDINVALVQTKQELQNVEKRFAFLLEAMRKAVIEEITEQSR